MKTGKMVIMAAVVLLSISHLFASDYVQTYKLTADDAAAEDKFGQSVAMSGNIAIIGAPYDDECGVDAGAAYLFDVTTGEQLSKIKASDCAAGDRFGLSVAINDSTAIVGAWYDDDDAGADSGSAYLFNVSDPRNPVQTFKLTASDAAAEDWFGTSVAISGNIAIVGSYRDDDDGYDSGSAYLFDVTTGNQLSKLKASDAASGDNFGHSVAICKNTAIVSAIWNDDAGSASGSAYLFDVSDPYNPVETDKLTASDADTGDEFGNSLALTSDTAIIGAYQNDDDGSDSGAAYMFDVSDPYNPVEIAKLTATDAAAGDWFGQRVALNDDTAIVGAPHDDDVGFDTGSAYLFDVNTFEQIKKLVASDGTDGDEFGKSVAINSKNALVGAPFDDDAGNESGSAYCFYTIGAGVIRINWIERDSESDFIMLCHYGGVIGSNWYHSGGATASDAIGRNICQGYDINTDTWFSMAAMQKPHHNHGVVVYGGKVYAFGGISLWDTFHPELEVYEPVSNMWSYLDPMPVSIRYFGTALHGDRIYVTGGDASPDFQSLDSLWIYDISENDWQSGPSMPKAVKEHCSAAFNGLIYTFGGISSSGHVTSSVQIYNTETGIWSAGPNMPVANALASATVLNNLIFVVGGNNGTGNIETVQILDPVTGIWYFGTDMPVATDQAAFDSCNGRLYVYFYGKTYEGRLSPETLHVDINMGDDSNNGLSREDAFKTIQKGIQESFDEDTVLVWPGGYVEDISFLGKAITVVSAADAAHIVADGLYAVSFINGEDNGSVLENFVIRDSNTAIQCVASDPTIRFVTVVNCDQGIWADMGANLDISNSILWDNANGDLINTTASWSYAKDLNSHFITKWGSQGSGNGEFYLPYDIDVDLSGYIYVADRGNDRIQKLTSNGVFVTKWGQTGSGDGQFDWPVGIAVDSSGFVYVTEHFNHRVQKFTSNGDFVTKWGSLGSGDGQFDEPIGIAVDSNGNVYVVDQGNTRVQKFTGDGTFITKWGTVGSDDGQFKHLTGIEVDSNGYVYVSDTDNFRIQKFSSNGDFVAKWGSEGNGNGTFIYANRVAVGISGEVYVTDYYGQPIQMFTSNGDFVTQWGSIGSGNGQFNNPAGVEVDSFGNVYIVDVFNHRVQKFALPQFANQAENDYHLKSERGRYRVNPCDPNAPGDWVLDEVTSPCIDAGDPELDASEEPSPNGEIVNIGAYGGTGYASRSMAAERRGLWSLVGDLNYDGIVNLLDMRIMAENWLKEIED